MKSYLFGLLGLFALTSTPPAQSLKLLGDLNTNVFKLHSSEPKGYVYDPTPGVSPARFLSTGTRVFFQATDGSHGPELWVSGTTPGSVRLLKDIAPGPAGSKPSHFCLFQGKVLFAAWTPAAGWEPWTSDGTSSGTRLLADLVPGKGDGCFYYPVILGKSLFFFGRANTNPVTYGLYRYDGGTKAPVLVKAGFAYPWYFPVPAGKYIAFLGTTGMNHGAVWVTDGTAGGTVSLLGSTPSKFTSLFQSPVASGNQVWFSAKDSQGWGLWKTDGKTASLLGRFNFPMNGWLPAPPLGSKILFAGADPFFNPYVLDTRTGKVSLLKKISNNWPHGFDFPVLWKGYIYFVGRDTSSGFPFRPSIWRTDGTPKGTVKVVPESTNLMANAVGLTPGAKYIFFKGYAHNEWALWRTDGTTKGTILLEKTPTKRTGFTPSFMTPLGNKLLYTSQDSSAGEELFVSDGTPAGTGLLKDIYPGHDTASSKACLFTPGLSLCWFLADDTVSYDGKYQLWVTGGAGKTTRRLLSTRFTRPPLLFPLGNLLLFQGTVDRKKSLWRSDGTSAGTFPFATQEFENPVSLGDLVLFQGKSVEGAEPWVTDGTSGGTRILKDIGPGARSGWFQEPVKLGRVVLFVADDGNRSLWVTDGTPAGTRKIRSDLVGCANLVKLGDKVLFEGKLDRSFHGREAWITDGTSSGTRRLLDLYKGTGDGCFLSPFRCGNKVLFLGTDGFTGHSYLYHLYSTDGTPAGTHKVSNYILDGIRKIERNKGMWGIPITGGKAIFWPILHSKGNRGPWVTDGTAKGTYLLKDFGPTYNSYSPVRAVKVGASRVWFPEIDHYPPFFPPDRIWETDGTPTGTRKIPVLAGSGMKSLLWPPALFQGKLLVTMDDVLHGAEPWLVRVGALSRRVGQSSGTAELECGDPVLGKNLSLLFTGLPPGSAPILMLGLPGKTVFSLAPQLRLYLDPAAGLLWAGALPGGAARWPVPNQPSLAGLRLGVQGLVFPTGLLPLGLDLTNGFFLTLGN